MSKSSITPIECTNCGLIQDFTLWNSINADFDPTLKDSLINRKLQQTDCDSCGNTAVVNYPMLYHDMSHKTLVYHLADLKRTQLEQEGFETHFEDYQFRVVESWNELIEKIKLLDANLDDKVIELFKMVILGQLEASVDSPLYFDEFMSAPDGSPVLSFVLVEDGNLRSFSVPSESFDNFEEQVAESLNKLNAKNEKWETVDREFARKILDQNT